MLEAIRIHRRPVNEQVLNQLVERGLAPLLARIIAARPLPEHEKGALAITEGRLADLTSPFLLKDMDKAVARLRHALLHQEIIAIETDHDCDGQTSHAVLMTCLKEIFGHPADKLQSYIGHRMQEGYGLSEALCARILNNTSKPTLLITADNGSADEPRIAQLAAAGIDVIVTDHHAIPNEGIPQSAYAVLNPTRSDCSFPDPYIAGCMVAWLLMAATRRTMIDAQELAATVPSATEVLDFVAVGTVADCVSLARSINNRVVVQYGLQRINEFKRPCWQALQPLLKNSKVQAGDLGFIIGPLLNSDGRLSDALGSVNFLLSKDLVEAGPYAQLLWQQNETRKRIQKELINDALKIAENQVLQGRVSLVIYLEAGHAGVHGIAASRIKDNFGRPTVILSPKVNEPNIITGSCRSIDDINVRDVLQTIHQLHPELLVKFGGHKAAAGLTIQLEDLELFSQAFEEAVSNMLKGKGVGPMLLSDGPLQENIDLNLLTALKSLAPFGREFDEPLFEARAYVRSIRRFGQNLNHLELKLALPYQTMVYPAIWFGGGETNKCNLNEGDQVFVVYSLETQSYQQKTQVNLNLKHVALI
jgi:single-stranded-DNA-specific exonuclease